MHCMWPYGQKYGLNYVQASQFKDGRQQSNLMNYCDWLD
jgi:hypothetical protein